MPCGVIERSHRRQPEPGHLRDRGIQILRAAVARQSPQAVSQTEALAQNLTQEMVRQMIENDLTRDMVEQLLSKYEQALARSQQAAEAGVNLQNTQLVPRLDVLQNILDLWPH